MIEVRPPSQFAPEGGVGMFIGGRWTDAGDAATIDVRDPASDALVSRVPSATEGDVTRAVDAAAAALPAWRSAPAAERARVLRRWFDLMLRDEDRLARIMTAEQGKPIPEARGEIRYAAGFLEWSAEEAKRIYGETVPASVPGKRIVVLQQPVGVAAAITPWNFPSSMITRKAGPALAAGCTMVVKPARQTPLSALALGELAAEAGVPDGVLNIITGESSMIGRMLLEDERVRKFSFTGSTEVGKRLMAMASRNVTNISLELGGHAPFIVFDDADIEAAVEGAIASKFRNGGQTCICANRIYVQEGIHEEFVAKLAAATEALRVGPGTADRVDVGPLIDDRAVAKVEAHVADAVRLGARVVTGGRRIPFGEGLTDRFYAPTVLDGVNDQMLVAYEETFGPIAPIIGFRTEEEVIVAANDTTYGLAAYFYTRDAARLIRVAEALDFGVIGANDALPSTPQAPFGGMKQSGLGREGGKWGVQEFLETKYVSVGIG